MLNLWRRKKRGRRGRMIEREHERAKESSREMALMLSTVMVPHPEVPSA